MKSFIKNGVSGVVSGILEKISCHIYFVSVSPGQFLSVFCFPW